MKIDCSIEDKRFFDALLEKNKGDEIAAYKEWLLNKDYPQDIIDKITKDNVVLPIVEEDTTSLTAKKEFLKRAADVLDRQTKSILAKAKSKNSSEAIEKLAKGLENVNKIFQANMETKESLAIVRFVEATSKMINAAYDRVKNLNIDINNATSEELNEALNYLSYFKENIDSFNILRDLKEEFINDPKYLEEYRHLTNTVDGISNIDKIDLVKTKYLEVSRALIVLNMSRNFTKVQDFYKTKAELIWNKQLKNSEKNKGLSSKELQASKESFINLYLVQNSQKIKQETKEYLENSVLETIDVDAVSSYMVNPKDLNHDIIGHAVIYLDSLENKKRLLVKEKLYEAEDIYNKFIKQVGKQGNPKKQYESLLEKDGFGNVTDILINPNSGDQYETFKAKYKGTAVEEMHLFLINLAEEKANHIPGFRNLKKGIYQLPRINKSTMERMYSNGVVHTFREGVKDFWKVRSTDTDLGIIAEGTPEEVQEANINKDNKNFIEVSTSRSGKEREEVPLFYRGQVQEEDLSYDVLSSMLLDYDNCLNWDIKMDAKIYLQSIKDTLSEAKSIQMQSFTKKIKKNFNSLSGRPVTEEGLKNAINVMDNLIRHRIYGIKLEGDPKTVKAVKALRHYSSLVSMAFNVHAGVTNYFQGNIINWIESTGAKSGAFNSKNLLNAVKKYQNPKDVALRLADIGERVPKSRVNLLRNLFDPQGKDTSVLGEAFIKNNRLKRNANLSTTMMVQELGEHAVESQLMYAYLDNIKVLDQEGNFLDKDFNPTKDRTKALSIDEVITFDEKGNYKINEKVSSTEITESVTTEDLTKITIGLRRLARDLYGNYSIDNKSSFERTPLGYLTMHLRGWMVPGIQKRWRGIGTIKTRWSEMDLRRLSYNQELNRFEEGTYTSFYRFVAMGYTEIKQLKSIIGGTKEAWNELTDYQKENAKKAVYEMGTAILLLTISAMLANLEGEADDDEKLRLEAAYIARRLYSELMTFHNLKEGLRTVRNPMMSLNMVEKAFDFLIQLTISPLEEYETGTRAGDLKLNKKLKDLIPILNQLDTETKDKLNYITR